jgi:hypothetical protein
MTHGRHRHGGPRCGPHRGRRRFSREEWLERLERYQRDLEQETADVADLIRRLKEEAPPAEPATTV